MTPLRIGLRCLLAFGLIAVFWLLAALYVVRPPDPLATPDRGATLGPVTLIEPGGSRREAVRLVIEGGRIARVEDAAGSEADAFPGTFVLPGLTDMHVHAPATRLPGDTEYTLLLLLSHGVTAVRMLGGTDVGGSDALRRRIDDGELAGPSIANCVIWIDGPEPVLPTARSVSGPAQARAAVEELAEAGADCIKPYDRLDRDSMVALRETAHALGLKVVGHTPQEVALDVARIDDVQHLRGVHPPFDDEGRDYPQLLRPWLRLDEARLDHVIDVSLEHGMAYTPTLVAVEATLRARDWGTWRGSPTMRSWLPHLRDGLWSADDGFNPVRFMSAADFEMVGGALENMKTALRVLHEAGVPLHTGTDCNAPNTVPGESLHRELALWVDAGIPPDAALAASTSTSPRFLGLEEAGRLVPGAPANLTIYLRDPTAEIGALDSLVAVVSDGRLFTRADLDARIDRYREHYAGRGLAAFVLAPLRCALSGITSVLRGASDGF